MALSNIFREPRRELTESVVGTVVTGLLLWADYHAAHWFYLASGGEGKGCPWPLGMILLPIVALGATCTFLFIPHVIGEALCDALARRGLELRPKRR